MPGTAFSLYCFFLRLRQRAAVPKMPRIQPMPPRISVMPGAAFFNWEAIADAQGRRRVCPQRC